MIYSFARRLTEAVFSIFMLIIYSKSRIFQAAGLLALAKQPKKRPGQPATVSGRTDQAPSRDGFAVMLPQKL